ncbi:MAG TPA: hypothetical protein PKZ70_08660, partial [Candidatus Atribacteria bacterium]|nr:hypothetical protein [Candidatus Atribacteria bacterium]
GVKMKGTEKQVKWAEDIKAHWKEEPKRRRSEMKTAKDVAVVFSKILGVPEERILHLIGEYVCEGNYYLEHPDASLPKDLDGIDALGNFAEYAGMLVREQEKINSTDREKRLLDTGWRILASANKNVFVVESPHVGVQVMHFYQDGPHGTPMVEGYFLSSFSHKAQNELLNDPEKFVGEFYLHCSDIEPDWHTLEMNLYCEPRKIKEEE